MVLPWLFLVFLLINQPLKWPRRNHFFCLKMILFVIGGPDGVVLSGFLKQKAKIKLGFEGFCLAIALVAT